jgi:ketosteroid isomerase-like protein
VTTSTPEVELHSRFAGLGGEPYRGPEGMRQWLADIQENFERFAPWYDELYAAAGERVVACGGISFRARESGVDMSQRMGWIFEFQADALHRLLFYASAADALEAAGLEP